MFLGNLNLLLLGKIQNSRFKIKEFEILNLED